MFEKPQPNSDTPLETLIHKKTVNDTDDRALPKLQTALVNQKALLTRRGDQEVVVYTNACSIRNECMRLVAFIDEHEMSTITDTKM